MFVLLQIQRKQSMITYNLNERKNMKNTEGNGVAKGASSPRRDMRPNIRTKNVLFFFFFIWILKQNLFVLYPLSESSENSESSDSSDSLVDAENDIDESCHIAHIHFAIAV